MENSMAWSVDVGEVIEPISCLPSSRIRSRPMLAWAISGQGCCPCMRAGLRVHSSQPVSARPYQPGADVLLARDARERLIGSDRTDRKGVGVTDDIFAQI